MIKMSTKKELFLKIHGLNFMKCVYSLGHQEMTPPLIEHICQCVQFLM